MPDIWQLKCNVVNKLFHLCISFLLLTIQALSLLQPLHGHRIAWNPPSLLPSRLPVRGPTLITARWYVVSVATCSFCILFSTIGNTTSSGRSVAFKHRFKKKPSPICKIKYNNEGKKTKKIASFCVFGQKDPRPAYCRRPTDRRRMQASRGQCRVKDVLNDSIETKKVWR